MAGNEILWPCQVPNPRLSPGEVHLWAFPLNANSFSIQAGSVLAVDERERAERFRFERDRTRFVAGRAGMRCILGSYLETEPARVIFGYGEKGKPMVSTAGGEPHALMFNLSHCEDLAVLAVTRTAPVGVDVERIRTIPDADQLVSRFFSPTEATRFHALPENQRPEAFFNLWTRKEAWLKATGAGIGSGLDQVEVSFLPGQPARLLSLGPAKDQAGSWSLHELTPAEGFTGAVAIAAAQPKIQCHQWAWPEEKSALGDGL